MSVSPRLAVPFHFLHNLPHSFPFLLHLKFVDYLNLLRTPHKESMDSTDEFSSFFVSASANGRDGAASASAETRCLLWPRGLRHRPRTLRWKWLNFSSPEPQNFPRSLLMDQIWQSSLAGASASSCSFCFRALTKVQRCQRSSNSCDLQSDHLGASRLTPPTAL